MIQRSDHSADMLVMSGMIVMSGLVDYATSAVNACVWVDSNR